MKINIEWHFIDRNYGMLYINIFTCLLIYSKFVHNDPLFQFIVFQVLNITFRIFTTLGEC